MGSSAGAIITSQIGSIITNPEYAELLGINASLDDATKIHTRINGAEHEDMLTLTDGYMTAWMLYQLYDDAEAAKVFVGDDAEITSNTKWQDIKKNK